MESRPKPTNPNNPIMQKEPTGPRSRFVTKPNAAEARKAESRDAENFRDAGARVDQKDAGQRESG